jgi:Cdc6-like AAA superfamily ATPase
MIEEVSSVMNPDILNETYIPPNIPGREAQTKPLIFSA